MPLEVGATEILFRELSETLDRVGPARRELFLAKLVLLLADQCGDPVRIAWCLAEAERDLDA